MLLETSVAIASLGFITFVVGGILRRPELAMIGAIIVIGLGATMELDGVQVKTGEIHNTTDSNETVISNQYEDIATHSEFPFGIVVILLGVVMFFIGSGEASEK